MSPVRRLTIAALFGLTLFSLSASAEEPDTTTYPTCAEGAVTFERADEQWGNSVQFCSNCTNAAGEVITQCPAGSTVRHCRWRMTQQQAGSDITAARHASYDFVDSPGANSCAETCSNRLGRNLAVVLFDWDNSGNPDKSDPTISVKDKTCEAGWTCGQVPGAACHK